MGNRLNRAELAAQMGVSAPTVDRWIKDGMPVLQRGSRGVEWAFDITEVIKWWGDRRAVQAAANSPTDLEEIEKRTAAAKMQIAELALAKEMGDVALVREFERGMTRLMANIQANVMNVPARAALQLLGEADETRFKQVLRAELTGALEQAASADFDLDEEAVDEEGGD